MCLPPCVGFWRGEAIVYRDRLVGRDDGELELDELGERFGSNQHSSTVRAESDFGQDTTNKDIAFNH
ncbi:hypothetical protein ACFX2F_025866 [Malus domestica]